MAIHVEKGSSVGCSTHLMPEPCTRRLLHSMGIVFRFRSAAVPQWQWLEERFIRSLPHCLEKFYVFLNGQIKVLSLHVRHLFYLFELGETPRQSDLASLTSLVSILYELSRWRSSREAIVPFTEFLFEQRPFVSLSDHAFRVQFSKG